VLAEIEAAHLPELLVFNKCDAAPEVAAELVQRHEGSVAISASTGEGIDVFLHTLSDRLRALSKIVELLIPYDRGDLLAAVHREGEVLSTCHEDDGVRVRARLADASAGRLSEFVIAHA
jgi:GTP-binding protein HflX